MVPAFTALLIPFSIALGVLIIIFILVPLLKGVGYAIGALFSGVGWLFMHVFEFIGGMIGDVLRFVGSIITGIVLVPLTLLNVVIGRWSAAGHFAESVKREIKIGALCLYRVALQRPLKLVLLHGLLEGVEQRVPEAMAGAPAADKPKRRTGQFEGYTIVGSLRGGGSGAKLYVAEPDANNRTKGMPERVVIKSFALTEGSTLPQIVRESRSLESARQLGLVLDHGMEEHRFFYVMPFHDGDHLGVVTRQLHAESEGRGLDRRQLGQAMSYSRDLLHTLSAYHRGGLWHKDVKPENIIVHDERAHLVDLGLITPLQSAMTLTTHGTEYFRDPEMVRQALRGVKVHQVDGARFDVYAVGAVLYFVLENTFPAHGGLSRFNMKSPEALRWIIKRAMTDYNQRYESTDEMLADLNIVLTSDDPYAVKPAALPSMGGAMAMMMDDEPEDPVAQVHHAASPQPPRPEPVGFAAAAAAPVAGVAQVNAGPAAATRSPKLNVTSWWTGAYTVDQNDANVSVPIVPDAEARDFRSEAQAFKREMSQVRQQVRGGVVTARKAAREQLKAARSRAQEIRRKARSRRHHYTKSEKPTAFLGFLVMTVVVVGSIIGVAALRESRNNQGNWASVMAIPGQTAVARSSNMLPVMLVVNVPERFVDDVDWKLDQIIEERARENYDVVFADDDDEDRLSKVIQRWYREGKHGSADEELERHLAAENLYGYVYVTISSRGNVFHEVIYSTEPDASQRRHPRVERPAPPDITVSHAPTERPILLVNDHPAKVDPRVEAAIESIVEAYRSKGWNVQLDSESEVKVRTELPIGPVDDGELASNPRLQRIMEDCDLGGVLVITAAPGDGKAHERIQHTLLITEVDTSEAYAHDNKKDC